LQALLKGVRVCCENIIGIRLLAAACAALGVLAAGCSHEPKLEARPITDRGYVSKQQFATSQSQDTWQVGDAVLDVSLIVPSGSGVYPLVIYLPGLGESVAAAGLWRSAWAQSGYAVFTVQPHQLGNAIWGSPRARAGQFTALAAEQFAAEARAARMAYLSRGLAELRRRAATGTMPYARVDVERAAIAGFDLGAATVAAVATSTAPAIPGWNWRAAIVLSPPGERSSAASRAPSSVALLCITGTADTDPFGLTPSPHLREAACRAFSGADQYALVLGNANHALLSGTNMYTDDPLYANGTSEPGGEAKQRKQRFLPMAAGGGTPPGGLVLNEGDDQHPALSEEPDDSPRHRRRKPPLPTGPFLFDLKLLAAVQAVTTAFLDATVKDDATARTWLGRDAAKWLGEAGVLQANTQSSK
jgi:hypothetical protein